MSPPSEISSSDSLDDDSFDNFDNDDPAILADSGSTFPPVRDDLPLPPLARLAGEVAAEEQDPTLRSFVELVLPNLLSTLSFRTGKGMGRHGAQRLAAQWSAEAKRAGRPAANRQAQEKRIQTLMDQPDQSLAVHLLNAALGAYPVVVLAGQSEEKRRLYLAGVTLHDLNKIANSEVRASQEDRGRYEKLLRCWGERLGLWQFIDESYLWDVAYLAHNAEKKRGEHRVLADFGRFRSDPADLEDLSDFVMLADVLASQVHQPDDVFKNSQGEADRYLASLIARLLRQRYVLRYHKTSDNRGLLTQEIHNAVLALSRDCGWQPFLYFPNGVTYLAPQEAPEPDLSALPAQVRARLVSRVQGRMGEQVQRDGKGLKWGAEYTNLLGSRSAGERLVERVFAIINDSKRSTAGERKEKMTLRAEAPADLLLDRDFPVRIDVDRLAEGLLGLCKLLEDYTGRDRDECGEALLRALGRDGDIVPWRAIESTGGVGYPWYYVAGRYIKEHTGLDPNQLAELMNRAYSQALEQLGEVARPAPFPFLDAYVPAVLSVGQNLSQRDFSSELAQYSLNKKPRGAQPSCALCNGAIGVRSEFSNFTNRRRVSPRVASERGICEMCSAEELLRELCMGWTQRGADGTMKFLHLYPSYYFTPVTARIMGRAYDRMQNATFFDLIKPYNAAGRDVTALLHADIFRLGAEPGEASPGRRLEKVEYSRTEVHGYYLLGVPYPSRSPSDTESWVMPGLLALLVPALLGVKVVVSASMLPPFGSGADFIETAILDGPHSFWQHVMGVSRFRQDELDTALSALLSVYELVADAFKDGKGFPIWNQLGGLSRQLDGDSLTMFRHADRIAAARKGAEGPMTTTDGMSPFLARRLMEQYREFTNYRARMQLKGEDQMKLIEGIVQRYIKFYTAEGFSAYGRLRPLDVAAKVILATPKELDDDSLHLQIEGKLLSVLEDMAHRKTKGHVTGEAWRDADRIPLVRDFTNYMVKEVFQTYCQGQRSLLRQRLNLLKNGCEAVYITHMAQQKAARGEAAAAAATQDSVTQERA